MIRVENLAFSYPDGTPALHDINIDIAEGEMLALMGANGCGKTTLLKHIIGLLKPARGNLYLQSVDFRLLKTGEVFRRVGMVFQDPNDQLFAATVEQDVAFGASNMGLVQEEVSRRVRNALTLVGALDLSCRAIHTLSFGQKRRVTIAGVLAMQPGVMLLDEPTSGLDPHGVSAVMRLLRDLNMKNGITMVMATHDVELVPLFCDRVAVMSCGTIASTGTPESIFADIPGLRETGMRLPRIGHLAEILRKEDGFDFSDLPLTIGEARKALCRPPEKLLRRSINDRA